MSGPIFKLSLSFKGRLLAVHRLEERGVVIGRDPGCDIVIDSLAVAPRHAQVRPAGEGADLAALDAAYPLLHNGRRVEAARLAGGDLILIGKHTLAVVLDELPALVLTRPVRVPAGEPPRSGPAAGPSRLSAYLQIQSGPSIGRVIRLERAVTRLKRIGGTEVIVTRQDGGYRLTRIGEANEVVVDGRLLAGSTEVRLDHRTCIEVDGTRCQFFDPAADAPRTPGAPASAS